jgi:hypothetical protein
MDGYYSFKGAIKYLFTISYSDFYRKFDILSLFAQTSRSLWICKGMQ